MSVVDEAAFVVGEFFYEVIYIAVQRTRDVAATVAYAVVGYTVLREVVGANLFAAVTTADEFLAGITKLLGFLVDLYLE